MIYLTGSGGLVGSRFVNLCDRDITKVSYRKEVVDVFDTHDESCLIHLGWSSTTRTIDNSARNDVVNSKKLFDYYLRKNPNGKIIFVSTAGDLHRDTKTPNPKPHSLYSQCKLEVENILNKLNCRTVIFRTTNIWGGIVDKKRVNGLVDKLFTLLNTDEVVEIYANLKTVVDIIHVDDFSDLLEKAIDKKLNSLHETFLVGSQNITIYDIIDIVSMRGTLNLKLNQKAEKSYLNIDNSLVKKTFDWEPTVFLK